MRDFINAIFLAVCGGLIAVGIRELLDTSSLYAEHRERERIEAARKLATDSLFQCPDVAWLEEHVANARVGDRERYEWMEKARLGQ